MAGHSNFYYYFPTHLPNIFLTVFVKNLLKKSLTKLSKPAIAKESAFQAQILIYFNQANNLTPFHQR